MILDPWRCSRPVVPKRLWGIRHYCRHNIPEESSSQKLFSFVRLLDSLLVYWLTYCMEQSPSWEANLFQLVKKSPAFYGTRRFITAFTSARHLSLSLANSIQSIPPPSTSWRSILILSSHLRRGLPSCLFPSGFFSTKTLHTPLPLPPIRATCPSHIILLDFITRKMLNEEYRSSFVSQ